MTIQTFSCNLFKNHITEDDINKAVKINEAGGNLYIVGGFIRDIILNRQPGDKDYCVEGLTPEIFENLFPEAKLVGKKFPVYLINNKEYSLAFKKASAKNNFNYFRKNYSPNITIKEDLMRRDFTINAMALDIVENKLITVSNSLNDIKNKKIRVISEKFTEDPLRVYRAARFAAELNFEVTPKTLKKMGKLKNKLTDISRERIYEEFKKALNSPNPDLFFTVLKSSKVLNIHFKEIDNLWHVKQPEKFHPEIFVHKHFLQSLQLLKEYPEKNHFRFAVSMHDIGKGLTPEKEIPRHYSHDQLGIKVLNKFVDRIIIPQKWYQAAKIAIAEHMRIRKWKEMKAGKVVKLFQKIKRSPLTIEDMINLVEIDKRARGVNKPLHENINFGNNLKTLYQRLFAETGGKDINSDKYSGEEFGNKLFQYRCEWLDKKREDIR